MAFKINLQNPCLGKLVTETVALVTTSPPLKCIKHV